MSLINDKNEVIRAISAQKSLSDGNITLSGNKLNKPLTSMVNKSKNPSKFLQDILVVLSGLDALYGIFTTIIAKDLPKIEGYIKTACKCQLKENINCGSNPSIPSFFSYSSTGIEIPIRNIDFLGQFFIPPTSQYGFLIYDDIPNGLNSKDFNVFLYDTIQTQVEQFWKYKGNDLLSVTYSSQTPTNTDVLIVKASQYYTDNMKLTDFNNDFIDSLSLFPAAQKFNEVIETLFGTISANIKLPLDWLKKKNEVDKILEKLAELDESDVIDDSFFSFTNDELFEIENIAKDKSKGIRKYSSCDEYETSVNIDTLSAMTFGVSTAATKNELVSTIGLHLTNITNDITANVGDSDKFSVKVSFYKEIFNALATMFGNILLSPKMAILFQMNHRLIYGNTDDITTPIDYIKKNKVMYRVLFGVITSILLTILIKLVTKEINALMGKNKTAELSEKIKSHKDIILSLLGISPDIAKIMNMIKTIPI